MAQFPGLSLTVQGNKMILKSSTGKTEDRLIITKAVIGDGQLTASIDGLTEIVSKKLEIGLSQVKEVANGQMQLQFNFDNRNVANGFYWREVGLYAKNGDSGEEKLIGYSNAKGLTSYIPDKTNVIPMQRLVIALGVGDNPNVKGEVDFTSAITLEQLETAIDTHNKAAEAHKEQFKTINENINAIEDSKVAKTSADYIKSLVTNTNGLEATKGNDTKELLKLLTNVDSGDNQGLAPTLALVKTMLGDVGIVAQRLEENGFVKFANGFTIQWGTSEPDFKNWDPNKKKYGCKLPIAFEHGILFADGQTETGDDVNHYTYININHAPRESTKEEVVFYTWTDWDWSYIQFRLAWMAFGY